MFPGFEDIYDLTSVNAFLTWVHAHSFMTWFTAECQVSRTSLILTPRKRSFPSCATPESQLPALDLSGFSRNASPMLLLSGSGSSSPAIRTKRIKLEPVDPRMLSDIIEIPSDSEDDSLTPCRAVPTKQVKLEVAKVSVPPSDVIEISSDSEDESSCTQHSFNSSFI